jgi:hypothetical protein
MESLSDDLETVDERDTGVYRTLTSKWSEIMIAGGNDIYIDALLKVRRLEPKYKFLIPQQYSEGAKTGLRSLAGLSEALYEIGVIMAIPNLRNMGERYDGGGIEEDDFLRAAYHHLIGRSYPEEFRSAVLKAGSSLAMGLSKLKDTELNRIDGEMRKSPLYPLVYQIVNLAYQYKYPDVDLNDAENPVACAHGVPKPPPVSFVYLADLVLEEAGGIEMDWEYYEQYEGEE